MDNELRTSLFNYSQYNILNKGVEANDQNQECENFSKEFPEYGNFKNFCHKLSRNIKNVCILMNLPLREREVSQKKVLCDNLNYWLYYILIKSKLLNNETNISKSKVFNVLPKLWDSTNCNQTCKLALHDMDTNDFIYMKELYDYSKHYKYIEYYSRNHEGLGCRSQYCSYISKVDKIYKDVGQICSSTSNKPYCTMYNAIQTDNKPSVFLSKIGCTEDDVDENLVDDAKIFGTEFQSLVHDLGDSSSVSTRDSEQELPDSQDQSTTEQSSSNKSVNVGLTLFGMSSIPLFLIYKVKINIYYTNCTFYFYYELITFFKNTSDKKFIIYIYSVTNFYFSLRQEVISYVN
ncbi:hypothetical protein PVMG_04849 [Plasmodium vivax Mauritania I]|uniref:Uncharacterized protein n=1 Tax=Plasmodium vivax Mauritania I TaxID=1035515 RepID=A0A0J9T8V4_PLAVI|nr:hypothetical protein PVMG_04849 [Plasmodium vivax Mauritania I]